MLGIASVQNLMGDNDANIDKIQQLKLQQKKDWSPTLDDSGLTMEVRANRTNRLTYCLLRLSFTDYHE